MRYTFILGVLCLVGCVQITEQPARVQATIQVNPTTAPTLAITLTPSPTPDAITNLSDTWQTVTNGIAIRTVTPANNPIAHMTAVRLDTQQVIFRVHYRPNEGLTLAQWREQLPEAQVIINANFFTPERTITGMLVSDGVTYGRSYTDRGGMFSIQNGEPVVQSLVQNPYDGRALEQAVQAFPMLVNNSQSAYYNARDLRPSRRSVIGLDSAGQVVMMATPALGMGLFDLSAWLPTTDLGLVHAFNLDGGGSTMLYVAPNYVIASFDPVPAVLAVYAR